MIKDSGDRTKFNSGAVRDLGAGKGRCDLLPACALLRLAKHFEAGAEKYGARKGLRDVLHRICRQGPRYDGQWPVWEWGAGANSSAGDTPVRQKAAGQKRIEKALRDIEKESKK